MLKEKGKCKTGTAGEGKAQCKGPGAIDKTLMMMMMTVMINKISKG